MSRAGKARILVVDDQPEVREFTSKILTRAGHEVALAANGRDALAAVQGADFDLILMDFNMPIMDGLTATREIRALEGRPSKTPIIAFSAGEQTLVTAGANDHICKPFDKAELLGKVDTWLDRDVIEPPPARPADKLTAFQEAYELMGRPWALRGLANLNAQIDETFGAHRELLETTGSWPVRRTLWCRSPRFSAFRCCRNDAARCRKPAAAGMTCRWRSTRPGRPR